MSQVFSAPGKALIAGGYLVLDPIYSSYVTALSARTHAAVKLEANDLTVIHISSPQFDSDWTYQLTGGKWTEIEGKKNPFLQSTVEIVMKYFDDVEGKKIDITIFSDPGFHTQDNTTTKKSTNGQKRFLYHGRPITEVAKTGLGSSASLVSVVTTVLVTQFIEEDIEKLKNLIHNLGQIAHCKAQKKIGSGFDVCTAVFGSINYRRFKPEVINDFINDDLIDVQKFKATAKASWDFQHDSSALPPHLKILMGDIKGGSETPKLVNLVLGWKKSNPEEGLELFTNLNNANLSFIKCLERLHAYYNSNREQYLEAIEFYKANASSTESKFTEFNQLIKSIKSMRFYLKQLTVKSKADIEPESQTVLLDEVTTLPGVLGGVVPGAGGYDAISLVVIDSSIPSIIDTTAKDQTLKVVDWLDLEEESSGIVEENFDDYLGLF